MNRAPKSFQGANTSRSNLKASYLTCFELDPESLGVQLHTASVQLSPANSRSSYSTGHLSHTTNRFTKSARPTERYAMSTFLDVTNLDEISLENLDPTELEVKSDTKVLDDLKEMYSKRNINSAPARRVIVPNGCYFNPGPSHIALQATKLKIPSRARTAKSGRRPLGQGLNSAKIYPHISDTASPSNYCYPVESTSQPEPQPMNSASNMEQLKEQLKQYHMEPMDHDTRNFSKQKKSINEKLKGHWKKELAEIEKGKIRKLNENAFKNEDEWMTIAKPPTDFEQTAEQRNEPISLIDTFTATIYDSEPQVSNSSYQVNSSVGTLIADKLSQGEKIRIGVNGKFVKNEGEKESYSKMSFSKLVETDKTYNPSSCLSWNQQVKDYGIKVIEPSVKQVLNKELPKKDNRSLVVKKLVDEDEFQPSIVKAQKAAAANGNHLTGSETNSIGSNISSDDYGNNKPQFVVTHSTTPRKYKIPVEVIGTNTIGHPFQQHIQIQKKKAEQETATKQSLTQATTTSNVATKKVEFKTQVLKQRPPLTLNDKNYSQLVDNLTKKYTEATVQAKQQKELEEQNQQVFNALYNSMNQTNGISSPKVNTNSDAKTQTQNAPTDNSSNQFVSSDFVTDLGMSRMNATTTTNSKTSELQPYTESKQPALNISSLDPRSNQQVLELNQYNIEEYNRQTLLLNKELLTHINKHITDSETNKPIDPTTTNTDNQNTSVEPPESLKNHEARLMHPSNVKNTIIVDNGTKEDTDCVITIKSFVTSSKKTSLPGTPQTYSSFAQAHRSHNQSSRHIKEFRTRARINVGETSQLSSLGGGFYYNTSKQKPLPSGYYRPPSFNSRETLRSRCSTTSMNKSRTPAPLHVTSIETKFFNISKPIMMFQP